MKKYFERASSVERRFISVTFLVLFLALNWIFVWPLFSDWSKLDVRRVKAQGSLKKFQDAIALADTLKPKVAALEGEASGVPAEDQSVRFVGTILSQAAASGVAIQNNTQGQVKTNQFFVEQARALAVTAGEPELVDFLYRLGTGDSLVRVRGLTLRPDPPRHALAANLTLVASYKKKAPVRAATPPPASPPAPAAKPAAAATNKPAATTVDNPKSKPPSKNDKPAAAKPVGPGVPKPSTPTNKKP